MFINCGKIKNFLIEIILINNFLNLNTQKAFFSSWTASFCSSLVLAQGA